LGWDIRLVDKDGNVVEVPSHTFGSTIVIGGSTSANATITYNYAQFYYEVFGKKGFMTLNGMKAKDAIPLLEKAIEKLGTKRSESYWDPTPGNAGYALSILLSWAKLHPEATFEIYP